MKPQPGAVYRLGKETRTVTAVDALYVHADCAGNYQTDHVICTRRQWSKWTARAEQLSPAPSHETPAVMRAGDRVIIRGANGHVSKATVADIRHIDELPSIGAPSPAVDQVHAILSESGVDLVAMLAYQQNRREEVFVAVRIETQWYDLHKQKLSITPVPKARHA